jgi:hypothetical protein
MSDRICCDDPFVRRRWLHQSPISRPYLDPEVLKCIHPPVRRRSFDSSPPNRACVRDHQYLNNHADMRKDRSCSPSRSWIARRIQLVAAILITEVRDGSREAGVAADSGGVRAGSAAKRQKRAKFVGNERLREYVQDRLDGSVRRPDGTTVTGPWTRAWKGLNKPHRQDSRGAIA